MNKPLNPTQQRVKALLDEAKKLSATPEFNENDEFTLHVLWAYPDPDSEMGYFAQGMVIEGIDAIAALMAKNMAQRKSYRRMVFKAIGHLFVSHPELIQKENGTDD